MNIVDKEYFSKRVTSEKIDFFQSISLTTFTSQSACLICRCLPQRNSAIAVWCGTTCGGEDSISQLAADSDAI